MNTTSRLVAALVVPLVALGGLRPPAAEAACGFACGVNSASIEKSPIRGLSTLGRPNRDGMYVLPGSLRLGGTALFDYYRRWTCRTAPWGPASGGPLSLGVHNGQLVGISASGRQLAPLFGANCMRRATFDIAVPVPGRAKEGAAVPTVVYRVRIDDRAATTSWFDTKELRTWVPAYKLMYKRPNGEYRSVCEESINWMEEHQLRGQGEPASAKAPGAPPIGHTGMSAAQGRGYGLIVQGELYDDNTGEVIAQGEEWFNIACAGSALAKMRLMGVDPMREKNADLTMATLRMITAKYDGQISHTEDGTPIDWERADNPQKFIGRPQDGDLGPVEAVWNAKGAMCVDHFRIWYEGFNPATAQWAFSSEEQQLEAIQRPRCAGLQEPGVWRSFTVRHRTH